jgi:hypothetical protein
MPVHLLFAPRLRNITTNQLASSAGIVLLDTSQVTMSAMAIAPNSHHHYGKFTAADQIKFL